MEESGADVSPGLHENDPEVRKAHELLTLGNTRALARGFQRPR